MAATLSACGSSDAGGDGAVSTAPATGAAASSAPAAQSSGNVVVNVKGMSFSPASITVNVGDKVTWRFDDGGIPHTVTGVKGAATAINSPILKEGDYSYTFDKAGTYDYICTLHPDMKGTVTVR